MKLDWKTCFRAGVSLFALYLCIIYWLPLAGLAGKVVGAAMPLLIGCVIAYIINILMSFYERHYFPASKDRSVIKSRRPVCMLAAFVTVVLIVVFLVRLVLPELVNCIELLVAQVPGALDSFFKWLESKGALQEELLAQLSSVNWRSKLEQIAGALTAGIGSMVNVVSTVFSGIVTALFALIFSIYLLLGKETLGAQFHRLMKRYIKAGIYEKLCYLLTVLNDCFHKYIVGQCTEAVILGSLCTLGMALLRLPYATMTGAVIAFTALIPVAGGYIGAAVGAFMIFTVSPMKALVFLIFVVILQQLENNLIYPKVVGSSMGLPAIWVLAAVTIGGGVMGVPGMLIGVPLASAAYRLLREDVNRVSPLPESCEEIIETE
ncbi:MAG: AI-2E family transporter [Oscillospiraceae bacterium]|nr:AI-2E family transporter [Oscillospiraceae bacterium]